MGGFTSIAAWVVSLGMAAAPSAPSALSLPGFRLHVTVDEALDPDALRSLLSPRRGGGVVLWVRTRSNALQDSLLENLGRAQEAYVELRPPVRADDWMLLSKRAPRAVAWLFSNTLGREPGLQSLTGRELAVEWIESDFSLEPVKGLRVRRAHWAPGPSPSLASWSHFRNWDVPKKWVEWPQPEGKGRPECIGASPVAPRFSAREALALGHFPYACGRGARARVTHTVSDGVLRWLYSVDPAVELDTFVGDDVRASAEVRRLLDRLEVATAPSP